ncbi:MAG TPA: hypothetical protein VHY31_09690 [Streptosporangiaceae bacterium]|nr:hypothetical protein [Streptosporangiaceae bacterium]
MRVRRPQAPASERWTIPARCVVMVSLVTVALLAATGCGSSGSSGKTTSSNGNSGTTGMTACGMTKTAANVPVSIQIAHGHVPCATALAVERDYAKAIASGQVPGTGGGAPVHVQGWTCQGFATPVVLKTGQASKCVNGGTEILAILPAPA